MFFEDFVSFEVLGLYNRRRNLRFDGCFWIIWVGVLGYKYVLLYFIFIVVGERV